MISIRDLHFPDAPAMRLPIRNSIRLMLLV